MNTITDLASSITHNYINTTMAMETVSIAAQEALTANPYLLMGATVITGGVLLYNTLTKPLKEEPKVEEVFQKTIPIESKTPVIEDKYEGETLNGKWHGRGVFISAEGDRYEGEFQNGQFHGIGKYETVGGEVYIGRFENNLYHGKGTRKCADGNEYSGEFKEGSYDGYGTLTYANGDQYTGEFQNDEMHGYGVYRIENGDVYEGQFVENDFQGNGVLTSARGVVYQGQFENNEFHGVGKIDFGAGSTYEGEFRHDMKSGKGIRKLNSESSYEGEFAEDTYNGFGMLITQNGDKLALGQFKNGKREGPFQIQSNKYKMNQTVYYHNGSPVSNKNNIEDNPFQIQAFGLPGAGFSEGYSLGIISDHMESYFENDPESLEAAVNPLKQAYQYCSLERNDENAEEILTEVQNGRSFLLPYGSCEHAMLINISPTPDGNFVEFEIYNSGEGLDNHEFDKETEKYQLMKKYRIPMEEWNLEIVNEIMSFRSFITTFRSYTTISGIEGAVHIKLSPEEQVWKKEQKGNNCELECLNAFAAQKLKTKYKSWRKQFFQDCYNAANEEIRQEPQVQKKARKLQLSKPD